jgi:hypothetical protein
VEGSLEPVRVQPYKEIVHFASTAAEALDFCEAWHAEKGVAREAYNKGKAAEKARKLAEECAGKASETGRAAEVALSRASLLFGAGLLTGLLISTVVFRHRKA